MWSKGSAKDTLNSNDYYHHGSIIRSCLSALHGALDMDVGATPSTGVMRRVIDSNDGKKDHSMLGCLTYEEWVRELWKNIPEMCKEETSNDATIRQLKEEFCATFKNFEEFERNIRHEILPIDKYSISHLVLQTAWEGENIMNEDGTW
jgi:hypothetical protein